MVLGLFFVYGPPMLRVWKYTIPTRISYAEIPPPAKFLHIGYDPHLELCAWVLVDDEQPPERWTLSTMSTGNPVSPNATYVGTFMIASYVGHIFVERARNWGPERAHSQVTKE